MRLVSKTFKLELHWGGGLWEFIDSPESKIGLPHFGLDLGLGLSIKRKEIKVGKLWELGIWTGIFQYYSFYLLHL